jgi:hypothetical protein
MISQALYLDFDQVAAAPAAVQQVSNMDLNAG